MARVVGLSRGRFYDLIERGVFLAPVYSLANRRPFYTAEMQRENLAARQSGVGCNGDYVLFYGREAPPPPPPAHRSSAALRPARQDHNSLLDDLRSLGLPAVTIGQVDEALATYFPNGAGGVDESAVLRTVHRHLRRLGTA